MVAKSWSVKVFESSPPVPLSWSSPPVPLSTDVERGNEAGRRFPSPEGRGDQRGEDEQAGPSLARCARSLRMTTPLRFREREKKIMAQGSEGGLLFPPLLRSERLVILSAAGAKDLLYSSKQLLRQRRLAAGGREKKQWHRER